MRLLLLFLLIYFLYRYGKYLFNRISIKQKHNPSSYDISNHQQSAVHKKNNEVEGEYVDFEEIKD
jgi:hypothetical protein